MNDQPLILDAAVAPSPVPLRAQLIDELRATVAATLHVAPDALDADLPLVDAGLTSVELIDLVVACQARHAIAFPPELLVGLTLGSLADAILAARDAGKDAR
ncbi:acyl carrier protein [Burkholderia sp. F1]|uniref:acyl carrier protein n=1 Tax=Burkholderia sp. F1 TaxID=3366817 RepID=UPI003D70C037